MRANAVASEEQYRLITESLQLSGKSSLARTASVHNHAVHVRENRYFCQTGSKTSYCSHYKPPESGLFWDNGKGTVDL